MLSIIGDSKDYPTLRIASLASMQTTRRVEPPMIILHHRKERLPERCFMGKQHKSWKHREKRSETTWDGVMVRFALCHDKRTFSVDGNALQSAGHSARRVHK